MVIERLALKVITVRVGGRCSLRASFGLGPGTSCILRRINGAKRLNY